MYAVQSADIYSFGEDMIMSDKSKENIKQSSRPPYNRDDVCTLKGIQIFLFPVALLIKALWCTMKDYFSILLCDTYSHMVLKSLPLSENSHFSEVVSRLSTPWKLFYLCQQIDWRIPNLLSATWNLAFSSPRTLYQVSSGHLLWTLLLSKHSGGTCYKNDSSTLTSAQIFLAHGFSQWSGTV